jgi:RNA polymerase sigma factor (sigma-70 family)
MKETGMTQDEKTTETKRRNPRSAVASGEQDTVSWYLHEIQAHPLLKHENSVELFKSYIAGRTLNEEGEVVARTPEAMKIRQKLVNSNLRLVISIVKTYRNSGLPMEDLIQEGNIGLMKAVERYDWQKGCKFSTYATWWIRQAIGQHVLKRKKTIRLPAHAAGLQRRMFSAAEEYKKTFNSEPSAEELAELLGTSERIVKATMQSGRQTISLSSPLSSSADGGDSTVEDTIADQSKDANPFDVMAEKELIRVAREVLAELNPKESAILRLRFGISEDGTNSEEFPISKNELDRIITRGEGLQNES